MLKVVWWQLQMSDTKKRGGQITIAIEIGYGTDI